MKLIWSIIYIVLLAILAHYIGELLPRKWFHFEKAPYRSFCWEKDGAIYDKIHIKKWKKKLPDLSRIAKYMVPKRVTASTTPKDLDRLIRETCVAEFIHVTECIIAVGVCFISQKLYGVILYLLFVIGNIPFILIQRYNRPHLVALRLRMLERDERRKNANSDLIL